MLDPKVHRYFAVSATDQVIVKISNIKGNVAKIVPLHPKQPEGAQRAMVISDSVLIERFDANAIVNENAPKFILMNYGILSLDKVIKNEKSGEIECIHATYDASDTNYKKKPICTWVANVTDDLVPLTLVELDYLFDANNEPTETPTWIEVK